MFYTSNILSTFVQQLLKLTYQARQVIDHLSSTQGKIHNIISPFVISKKILQYGVMSIAAYKKNNISSLTKRN